MAIGLGLIALINKMIHYFEIDAGFFRDPYVELPVVVLATFIVVLAGAIAGLIPALKAAKINPVEAIRK